MRRKSALPSTEDIMCVMPSHTLSAACPVSKRAVQIAGPLFPIRRLLSYNEYISHKRKALWEKGREGKREREKRPIAERSK